MAFTPISLAKSANSPLWHFSNKALPNEELYVLLILLAGAEGFGPSLSPLERLVTVLLTTIVFTTLSVCGLEYIFTIYFYLGGGSSTLYGWNFTPYASVLSSALPVKNSPILSTSFIKFLL